MLTHLTEVFRSLSAHDVRYLVIGGVAAIVHGVPRATFDVDLLIEAAPANVERLLKALDEAGLRTAALTNISDLLAHEITIFKDVVRIDVQTRTPGLEFDAAWSRRESREVDGVQYWIVSKADLIASKRASGHTKDLTDIRILGEDEIDDRRSPTA